jgi:prefoldin subunit 5
VNVERTRQIIAELQDKARVAVVIEKRYGAHFQLHGAAVLNRDRQEMEQRRDELHTILDSLLSNAEEIQRLNDELGALTKS